MMKPGESQLEDFLKEIFSRLPFPAGTAIIPKNIMKTMISPEPFFTLLSKKRNCVEDDAFFSCGPVVGGSFFLGDWLAAQREPVVWINGKVRFDLGLDI